MTTPLLHVWLIRQVLWASLVFASSVSSVTVTKTTTTASSSTVSTPTLSTAASIARAPSASYGGGPVISNVEATIIFYNSTSTDQKDLKDYYNFLVQSPLVDALQEYSTPTQTIGRGHVVGSYFENKNLKQTLDNLADIRPYLRNLTIAGIISPNDNSYYPIHFASGIQITDSSGQSCVTFGGYHSATYVADIANVTYLYYAVLPNCGQRALDMAPAISHELAEAITDPLYPRGWNSAALSAEIGDICAGFYTQLSDAKGKLWYVQNIWSNMQKKCGATPLHAPSSTVTTSTTTTRVSTQTWIPFTSNGMIMPNIQVTPVLYGEFMDMLSEYSVGATIVGRGQVLAAVSLNADGALSLNDPIDIMQLFRDLVSQNIIQPNKNSFYPIHLAPNITVRVGNSVTCNNICAYSSSIDISSWNTTANTLYYALIPDTSTISCSSVCGPSPDPFRNLAALASVQVASTVTKGWFSSVYGGVAAVCSGQLGPMMDSTGAIWTIQRIWSNALQKCTNVPALSVNRTFWYTTTTTTSTTTSKTSTTSPTSSTTSSSSTSTTTTTTVSLAANIQAVIGNGFFGGLQKAVRTVSVTSLTSSMTKSQLSSRTPAANSSTYTSTSTSSTTTLSSTTTSKSAFTSSTRSILISTPPSSISTVTSTITTASQPIISPPNLILSNPGVNYVYGGVLNESLAPEKKAESESYTSTFFSHMAEALTSTSAIPANKTSIGQTNGFAFLLLAYLFYV